MHSQVIESCRPAALSRAHLEEGADADAADAAALDVAPRRTDHVAAVQQLLAVLPLLRGDTCRGEQGMRSGFAQRFLPYDAANQLMTRVPRHQKNK